MGRGDRVSKGRDAAMKRSSKERLTTSMLLLVWTVLLALMFIVSMRSPQDLMGLVGRDFGKIGGGEDGNLGNFGNVEFLSRLRGMSMEIFCAPKPFVGTDKVSNTRAIQSWLKLRPKPTITLLGWEEGYEQAAAEFGLNIDRNVDKNFLGVPLFNSMFKRANESDATVTLIVNGDILLTSKFMDTLQKTMTRFKDFLLISARFDVDDLPNVSVNDEKYFQAISDHALSTGTLHTYGGMDLWAWNTNGPRLFDPVMPHFVFGRGKYDNWLTHETIVAGRREVVDGSETSVLVHVRHDYHLVEGATAGFSSRRRLLSQFWSEGKKLRFEQFINIYLSLSTGSYSNQRGTILSAPWKMAACLELSGMCLQKRKRPGVCNCEYSAFVNRTQTDPEVRNGSRVIRCGMLSTETKEEFVIQARPNPEQKDTPIFGLPLTLDALLDRLAVNNTIVLTALNYGYSHMMMSWVCNLRHLNITNFIVAALDEELYKWAVVRGLPVYLETSITEGISSSMISEATYGTDNFKQLTKMKSRVVLRILQLGYNVVWSDCDIVWFKNPLPHLMGHDADLVIQTNAPDDEPANGKRRINSGFYLARSNEQLIQAIDDVVKFAAKSKMSEQPCFYDVLCGKELENVVGDSKCNYDGVVVELLSRELYPNGKTKSIWDSPPGRILDLYPNLFILHNNWVTGSEGKHERFQKHGLLFFEPVDGVCIYPTNW